jgi:hypothetical protein
MRQLLLLAFAAAVAISASSAAGVAYAGRLVLRTNPPVAHTGGFGEPTCLKCHQQHPLNDTTGSLTIEGVPERYKPGQRYRITVTVLHRDLVVAGFQLAARYDEGERTGKQAGRFETIDTLVTIASDSTSDVKYVHHSTGGVIAAAQRGKASFTFDWIAPESDSFAPGIVLHAVANAGNDDFSELGDYIFARSARMSVASQAATRATHRLVPLITTRAP